MAPASLLSVGTALLICAGEVAATSFYLEDTYRQGNFFDKFNFFESRYDTGDYNDVDLNSGYINYRSRKDAAALGLIKNVGDEVYIGVDHETQTEFPGVGRSSVRIESKEVYNKGLFIARFSHLPKPVCGAWPAFWSYGDPWPKVGELDWYEGWNEQDVNKPTIHTNHASENGTCTLGQAGQTSLVTHDNCDTYGGIWNHMGCTSTATHEDPWGSSNGGVYAVEWTSESIKFYSWTHANAPLNVDSDEPDTSTWGTPSVLIANDLCNVDSHFADQRLVLNINFCGVPVGMDHIWLPECSAKTQSNECGRYVAENPEDFEDVYWQIQDIRYFTETEATASSSAPSSSGLPPATSDVFSATSSAMGDFSSSIPLLSSSVPVNNTALPSTSSAPTGSSASSVFTGSSSPSETDSVGKYPSSSVPVLSPSHTGLPPWHFANSSIATSAGSHSSTLSAPSLSAPISTTIHTSSEHSSSLPQAGATTTSLVTSTVYTTRVTTITKCPGHVKECPGYTGKIITETVPAYTTVCPAVIATKTLERVHVVTACPFEGPLGACPYGSKSTETITTTVTSLVDSEAEPTHDDYVMVKPTHASGLEVSEPSASLEGGYEHDVKVTDETGEKEGVHESSNQDEFGDKDKAGHGNKPHSGGEEDTIPKDETHDGEEGHGHRGKSEHSGTVVTATVSHVAVSASPASTKTPPLGLEDSRHPNVTIEEKPGDDDHFVVEAGAARLSTVVGLAAGLFGLVIARAL